MNELVHYRWGRSLDAAEYGFADLLPSSVPSRFEARIRPALLAIQRAFDAVAGSGTVGGARLLVKLPEGAGWVRGVMSATARDAGSRAIHTWHVAELPGPLDGGVVRLLERELPLGIDIRNHLVWPESAPRGWPRIVVPRPTRLPVDDGVAEWVEELLADASAEGRRAILLFEGAALAYGSRLGPVTFEQAIPAIERWVGARPCIIGLDPVDRAAIRVGPALAAALPDGIFVGVCDEAWFADDVERTAQGARPWREHGWSLRELGRRRVEAPWDRA